MKTSNRDKAIHRLRRICAICGVVLLSFSESYLPVSIYQGDSYFYAVDATGSEEWRFKTKKRCRNPLVAGSTVYTRCDDHYLYALDAESGVLRWSIDTRAIGSTPMIAGGIMYSLSSDGVLQAFR